MPTIAEKWLQEGMEKGMEKGIEKEKIETVRKMISREMKNEEIAEITGLDQKKIELLRKEMGK